VPRRKEEIALRAQRIAAFFVALGVLRPSSALGTFFRSTNIHALAARLGFMLEHSRNTGFALDADEQARIP
jgi:hypothetical protein